MTENGLADARSPTYGENRNQATVEDGTAAGDRCTPVASQRRVPQRAAPRTPRPLAPRHRAADRAASGPSKRRARPPLSRSPGSPRANWTAGASPSTSSPWAPPTSLTSSPSWPTQTAVDHRSEHSRRRRPHVTGVPSTINRFRDGARHPSRGQRPRTGGSPSIAEMV